MFIWLLEEHGAGRLPNFHQILKEGWIPKSLSSTVHGVAKSQTRLSDFTHALTESQEGGREPVNRSSLIMEVERQSLKAANRGLIPACSFGLGKFH